MVETRTAFEHRARCMERSRSREPGLHLLILRRSLCLGLGGVGDWGDRGRTPLFFRRTMDFWAIR